MLARNGHHVGYCSPWTEAFPRAAKAYIGRGLEGLLPVDSFSRALEKCDCVVCPDTFSMDRVHQARAAGKPVFGAGHAEKLEQDRAFMKDIASATKIPLGPYVTKHGIDELTAYLEKEKDVWVKTSKWRTIETFYHIDWESTKQQFLGPILNEYGPVANEIDFIVEKPIKGVEIGADCLFMGKEFLRPLGYGYEAKDEAYIGTTAENLPEPLALVNDKLERVLASYGTNSFVSTEVRVSDKGYLLEPTIRCPHPPTAGMLMLYNNLHAALTLEAKKLVPVAKYCAVLVVRSSWAGDHWCEVEVMPAFRPRIKLSQACRLNGKYFAVPGNEFVAYAVGIGNTLKAAVAMCKDSADGVKCRDKDCNPSALDYLVDETIPEGKKKGIEF